MLYMVCSNILKKEQSSVQAAQQVGYMLLYRIAQWCVSSLLVCLQVQAKAQAMATALQTIGKFMIKKRSGDKESIFGR